MQILFGAHETIIKINSKSMNIEYVQHYISTHFSNRSIIENSINIPSSKTDLYHRTFLLKWLYSLYVKKNKPLPELKESLLKRYYKAIKIILPQKILHLLKYKIINDETLHVSISPQNSAIALIIKTFLQTKITVLPTYLQINFESKEEKKRLRAFLFSEKIINIAHKHIYDKRVMKEFLDEKKELSQKKTQADPLLNAYMILQMTPTDDIQSIKKQYKYLAKEWHPDRVGSDDRELIKLHTKKFQELLESYEILLQSAGSLTYI